MEHETIIEEIYEIKSRISKMEREIGIIEQKIDDYPEIKKKIYSIDTNIEVIKYKIENIEEAYKPAKAIVLQILSTLITFAILGGLLYYLTK